MAADGPHQVADRLRTLVGGAVHQGQAATRGLVAVQEGTPAPQLHTLGPGKQAHQHPRGQFLGAYLAAGGQNGLGVGLQFVDKIGLTGLAGCTGGDRIVHCQCPGGILVVAAPAFGIEGRAIDIGHMGRGKLIIVAHDDIVGDNGRRCSVDDDGMYGIVLFSGIIQELADLRHILTAEFLIFQAGQHTGPDAVGCAALFGADLGKALVPAVPFLVQLLDGAVLFAQPVLVAARCPRIVGAEVRLVKHIPAVNSGVVFQRGDGLAEIVVEVIPHNRVVHVGPHTVHVVPGAVLVAVLHVWRAGGIRHKLLRLVLAEQLQDGLHAQFLTEVQHIPRFGEHPFMAAFCQPCVAYRPKGDEVEAAVFHVGEIAAHLLVGIILFDDIHGAH